MSDLDQETAIYLTRTQKRVDALQQLLEKYDTFDKPFINDLKIVITEGIKNCATVTTRGTLEDFLNTLNLHDRNMEWYGLDDELEYIAEQAQIKSSY